MFFKFTKINLYPSGGVSRPKLKREHSTIQRVVVHRCLYPPTCLVPRDTSKSLGPNLSPTRHRDGTYASPLSQGN